MDNKDIESLINQRRRQVLIHSFLYYRLDNSYIEDHLFDKWAKELADLQDKYPEIAEKCFFAEGFRGFDGSSGFDLPLDDPWVERKALWLLNNRSER